MPFLLTRKNLEELKTDAKVIGSCPYRNNARSQGWHPDLWAEQRRIQQLAPGESMVTSGAEFDAKCGIVTMPPIWEGGSRKEDLKLAACYDSALRLAHRRRCRSIAFPLLSGDCHGFPKDLALETAVNTIREFLDKFEMTVYLSVREPWATQLPAELLEPVMAFLRRELEEEAPPEPRCYECVGAAPRKLEDLMRQAKETFSQSLLRIIDEKGLKDPEVYKRANVDRRVFSKLRSNHNYQPSKTTALAFALALELNLDETMDLIGRAGYALSPSSKGDIIVKFYIEQGNYDLYEINQVLFSFDQPLIGS